MATGETGFEDVAYDLISVQYHSLKAGHDYGQYVRDADNAGLQDIAAFFREAMEQDSARARRCHEFLRQRSEEHTSELQSRQYPVCRLLLEKKTTAPALYAAPP